MELPAIEIFTGLEGYSAQHEEPEDENQRTWLVLDPVTVLLRQSLSLQAYS
jgi:hypothetical protein